MLSQGPQASLSAQTEAPGFPGIQPKATHSALVHPGTQSDSQTHSLPWRERVGHGKSVHFDQADGGGGLLLDPPLSSCV